MNLGNAASENWQILALRYWARLARRSDSGNYIRS